MSSLVKRRLAIVVAFVALLAGGTAVALGASGSHAGTRSHSYSAHRGSALLSAAAGYLGVSSTELRRELHSGRTLAQLANATPGHSEAGLIAALAAATQGHREERLTARLKTLVNTPAGLRAGAARPRGWLRASELAYLGIPRRQLAGELRSGKTLAQIADSIGGKSSAGLVDAILAAATQRLNAAVGSGRISGTAEPARLAALRVRVTALVDRVHHAHAPS
ncbi:MAG: hypothetical protein ACLQBB_08295 [Solirubrobacteraceae bacterium]